MTYHRPRHTRQALCDISYELSMLRAQYRLLETLAFTPVKYAELREALNTFQRHLEGIQGSVKILASFLPKN